MGLIDWAGCDPSDCDMGDCDLGIAVRDDKKIEHGHRCNSRSEHLT